MNPEVEDLFGPAGFGRQHLASFHLSRKAVVFLVLECVDLLLMASFSIFYALWAPTLDLLYSGTVLFVLEWYVDVDLALLAISPQSPPVPHPSQSSPEASLPHSLTLLFPAFCLSLCVCLCVSPSYTLHYTTLYYSVAAYAAVHGVVVENPFEMMEFGFLSLLSTGLQFVFYFFTDISKHTDPLLPYSQLRFVLAIGGNVVCLVLAFWVSTDFGYRAWHDPRIAARMEALDAKFLYQFFVTLFRLDLLLGLVLVSAASLFLFQFQRTVVINVAALVVTISGSFCGYLAVRSESSVLLRIFWATTPLEPAYIIYKIVDFRLRHQPFQTWIPTLEVLGCVALMLRFALIWASWKTSQHFGLGVLRSLFVPLPPSSSSPSPSSSSPAAAVAETPLLSSTSKQTRRR